MIGTLKGAAKDIVTGKWNITFEIEGEPLVEGIQDQRLEITAKKYRKRRSLDANAYCWVLVTKIAEVMKSSKEEIYEELLQKYGLVQEIPITVKAEVDMSQIDGHWFFLKESSDGKWKSYLPIRGTSTYDSKEMANFIDRVVDDAKELGIETLPPDELERMVARWGTA